MERPLCRPRTLDRRGETFTDHTQGSDLCPDGRDRGRCYHLAPRAAGRSAELGLSILLAAGCHVHAHGLDESRLLRRSAGMARLAGQGGRWQPASGAIMYGVGGERWLPELIVPWLRGYENSSPVRIGNGAFEQLQLDVFGETADAIFQTLKSGMQPSERGLALRPVVLDYLSTVW